MEVRTWYRASSCGEGDVFSRAYVMANPKAIIQIAHGMCEHSERYDEFAQELAKAGYVVCANDHLGHGRSHMGHMGSFALTSGGFDYVIEDMNSLFQEMKEEFPGLPMILLGHSMGSILSALFAERHDYLQKLILMGTPVPNKMTGVAAWILGRNVAKHGYTYQSWFCNYVMWGGKTPSIERRRKSKSWLSYNEANIERFIQDEQCNFSFNDSANLELVRGLEKWSAPTWGDGVKDIPILIIAGADDKIGGYGKGPRYYYRQLKRSRSAIRHTKVSLQLVPNNKHEVLNERNKKDTYGYLIDWLDNAK